MTSLVIKQGMQNYYVIEPNLIMITSRSLKLCCQTAYNLHWADNNILHRYTE
jgi:hypothetical protein